MQNTPNPNQFKSKCVSYVPGETPAFILYRFAPAVNERWQEQPYDYLKQRWLSLKVENLLAVGVQGQHFFIREGTAEQTAMLDVTKYTVGYLYPLTANTKLGKSANHRFHTS